MSMSKSKLVAHLSSTLGLTKAKVGEFLDELAATAKQELNQSGEFALHGIGKLKLVHKPARQGRRPSDGATIDIPAKTVIKVSVTKALKDAVQ